MRRREEEKEGRGGGEKARKSKRNSATRGAGDNGVSSSGTYQSPILCRTSRS